ncbi:LysM peptidoglycan-binding domain-containing protein [Anditalea andensis]|uniref:Glycoside hydrolase family 23 n=1 Tax=Anditalea andensis TaxID=1048983 RepID=A0A074LKJ5_9BACT|nr:LysM peptidoglycan-binding domain-containing protein [Anditalea andensis]KEO74367.1 glycoside hydrolase family 23 [Anditalea andensis]
MIINRLLIVLTLCFFTVKGYAQVPQVPSQLKFADLTLRLNQHAQREIQQDVDALYRNQTYFKIKLDRVNLYMPTIERVLREEGLPPDVKYLVIQESSLISDAVSTSNAVGFWQFKQGTAEEVFMRVDNQIDERKNIVASTRGAALYLKKHNRYLDNWMCAVVSYQMGLGGARGYFGEQYSGKKVIDIDKNSHWYFKKFLAHKIAFEGQIGQLVSNGSYLEEMVVHGPTDLGRISSTIGVSENHLKEYNKWATNGKIPAGKPYTVVYIREGSAPIRPVLTSNEPASTPSQVNYIPSKQNKAGYPNVTGNTSNAGKPNQIKVNSIKAVQAQKTGSQEALAEEIGIREGKLRRVNDLKKKDKIVAGNYYYTKRKKGKSDAEEHIVQPGENLWQISQRYGIRLHSLKAKNRIYKDADLKTGMVLKLKDYRKRNEDIEIIQQKQFASPPQIAQRNEREVTIHQPPGQTLSPSVQASAPVNSTRSQAIYHKVTQGETLYALSKRYNVTVDQLRQWNNMNTNSILSVGQQIVIRK